MTDRYDVVVAGGAIMGSAVAYFLGACATFDGRVLVVERDPTYSASATLRSWGGVRQQFSTPENVRMSLFGAEFLRRAPELLAVGGERPEVGFVERGYLFLASAAGYAQLSANVRRQNALGADVALLSPAELCARFPWLDGDGLAGGGFGLTGEGWFDPESLLRALRRKALALGADYVHDEVVGVTRRGGRVVGVRLRRGGAVDCAVLVNAAGPHAATVAALAGCALPVRPRKRTTFVFDCRENVGAAPLVVDPTGVAFRPEGRRYIALVSPPDAEDEDAAAGALEPDEALFERIVWPALARRVPRFEAVRQVGAWAGLYDVNTFDRNAILGWHPEIGGLAFCNGFSGHGAQQAPAAGRAVCESIVHGGFRTLDLSALTYARIRAGRRLPERNVV